MSTLTVKHSLDSVDDSVLASPHKLPRRQMQESQDVQIHGTQSASSDVPALQDMRLSYNSSVFAFRHVRSHARGIAQSCIPKENITQSYTRKLERRNQRSFIFSVMNHGKRIESGHPAPSNVLVHLTRRSICPVRLVSRNSWKKCNSVSLALDQSPHHTGLSYTHVQFDSQGVLLAMADSKGLIRIYDFDEVQYQTLLARRNDTVTQNIIPPILSFRALSRVSCLKWIPDNEDEIALSFTASSEMRIYDLASMDGITGGPTFTRISPPQTFSRGQSISCFLFLPKAFIEAPLTTDCSGNGRGNNNPPIEFPSTDYIKQDSQSSSSWLLTGGSQGLLMLWRMYPAQTIGKQPRRVHQVWSINAWKNGNNRLEGISDLALLRNGLILIAGDKGSIVLINTASCTYKAFSTQATPELIQYWYLPSFTCLQSYNQSNAWMGIRNIHAGEWNKWPRQNELRNTTTLHCDCSLVTFGGWIIHFNLDIVRKSSSFTASMSQVKIVHKSPNTIYLPNDDSVCDMMEGAPSLPDFPSPAMILSPCASVMCVASVKQTRIRVGVHDERILDRSCSRHDVRDPDGILFVTSNRKSTVEVQKTLLSAFPVAIDIHPTNDCIVVCVTEKESGKSDLVFLTRPQRML